MANVRGGFHEDMLLSLVETFRFFNQKQPIILYLNQRHHQPDTRNVLIHGSQDFHQVRLKISINGSHSFDE